MKTEEGKIPFYKIYEGLQVVRDELKIDISNQQIANIIINKPNLREKLIECLFKLGIFEIRYEN